FSWTSCGGRPDECRDVDGGREIAPPAQRKTPGGAWSFGARLRLGGDMNEPVIFGTHDDKTLEQLRDVASRAERVALMADGHLGYVMPIGGVAAYRDQVSVVGVGFDIACGNAAIRTNRRLHQYTRADLEHLADAIQRTISFGMGRTNRADDAPTDHPLFEHAAWDALPGKHERDGLRAKAR